MRYIVVISLIVFLVLVLYLGVLSLEETSKPGGNLVSGNAPPATLYCVEGSSVQREIARDFLSHNLTEESLVLASRDHQLRQDAILQMQSCMDAQCDNLNSAEDVFQALTHCLGTATEAHGLETIPR